LKVVIADDHMIIRRGMQLIVSQLPAWTMADAADSGELFDVLRRERFDVVVMDLSLREHSGFELIDQLRREFPHLPVLILSSRPEEQYALQAIRAGARGYVQKDATAEEIISAIERVAAGRTWISESLAQQMAEELSRPTEKAPHELLSPRELEVFRSIATGRSMSEIAASMSISIKTASTFRSRILQKMTMRTNADIVAYAIRRGLI
jgi:DNA-binding NarL/FixJ family response regulator